MQIRCKRYAKTTYVCVVFTNTSRVLWIFGENIISGHEIIRKQIAPSKIIKFPLPLIEPPIILHIPENYENI